MNTIIKSFAFLAFCLFSVPCLAQNGTGSHGGDTLVFEFTGTAENLQKALVKLSANADYPAACPNPSSFLKTIQETHYTSAPVVYVKQEQDGKNWVDENGSHIEISRLRFTHINNPTLMLILVLHEYLALWGLEDTNDQRLSKTCVEYVEANGFPSKDLVYHINPITTVEQKFSDGELSFSCKTEKSSRLRIVLAEKYFCEPNANVLMIEEQTPQGVWNQIVRSGCRDKIEWKNLFYLSYSTASGQGEYRLNSEKVAKEMGGVTVFELSSLDHSLWTLNLLFSNPTQPQIRAQCSPELKMR